VILILWHETQNQSTHTPAWHIAKAIEKLITANTSGIYHVVGGDALSPYDATRKIARAYGLDESLVSATAFSTYFAGKAPRPLHAVVKNDKITKFGVPMATFDEGLAEIKKQ